MKRKQVNNSLEIRNNFGIFPGSRVTSKLWENIWHILGDLVDSNVKKQLLQHLRILKIEQGD